MVCVSGVSVFVCVCDCVCGDAEWRGESIVPHCQGSIQRVAAVGAMYIKYTKYSMVGNFQQVHILVISSDTKLKEHVSRTLKRVLCSLIL